MLFSDPIRSFREVVAEGRSLPDEKLVAFLTVEKAAPLTIETVKRLRDEGILDLRASGIPDDRIVPWTTSDETRDRYGDRITVKGWQLKNYRKNPVVLANHDPSAMPIGQAVKTWKDNSDSRPRLRSLLGFTTEDINPLAETTFKMVKAGLLRTASVGFRAIDAEPDPDADDTIKKEFWMPLLFNKQELLEQSVVTIPANPKAIAEAKSYGIQVSPLKEAYSRILDGEDKTPVSRDLVELAYREVAGPVKPTVQPNKGSENILEGLTPEIVMTAMRRAFGLEKNR